MLEQLFQCCLASGSIAPQYSAGYDWRFMLRPHLHLDGFRSIPRVLSVAVLALAGSLACGPWLRADAQTPQVLPLNEVKPGMLGYAYTIFSGDQIEKFDLEVIGVMPNFLGPRQSIILVQLKGPKVEHTGVVAGMSGSPVYLEGKLAGALSLKLGVFTKEPIAGVTPIEDVLHPELQGGANVPATTAAMPNETIGRSDLFSGTALQSIETPLIFSGFPPVAIQPFAKQLEQMGFVAAQGGTAAPRPDDAHLVPGDMAGMVLVQGDASINAACTVTAVEGNRVFLCGHPFLNLGNVDLPMARGRVLTTLSSDLASTKIVNVGGTIGTINGDHLTAVTGALGAAPPMVPLDLEVKSAAGEKKLHFEIVNHPKLTPLLVAMTTLTGLTQNDLYGEGTTLSLSGEIDLKGHVPVQIENTFAPGDSLSPDGLPVALDVMSVFSRIFTNAFETPVVQHITLRVESKTGRQSYGIESAWLEKGEASPGDMLKVRVLLRPYRGAPRVVETSVRVPDQASRGTKLRIMVSDADWMNRASRGFAFPGVGRPGGPEGLDQLISLLNRERRNDRVYVGLFLPSPTLLWDDKELPNVPLSEINIVDGRPAPGSVQVLSESLASEASVPMGGPVSGIISLNLPVR
jgi:SpoIVB peptidase S55